MSRRRIPSGTGGITLLSAVAVAATLAACSSTDVGASRNALPSVVPSVPAGTEFATARTAFETGNFGYAARYFEMAAEDAPGSMEACLGLAASYDWLYRFDLAKEAYGDCRKIDGDDFAYYNNIGFSHLLRGEFGQAAVAFARAESLRPGHPVVRTNLRILRDVASG